MKIKITQGFTDSKTGKILRNGDEITVSDERGQKIIDSGRAEMIATAQDVDVIIADKDKIIAQLERKIEKLQTELKKPE